MNPTDTRTSRKLNCWDFNKCGRGPSERNSSMHPCRAALETSLDNMNGGVNAGRICWAVAGSLGVDEPDKDGLRECFRCEFRHTVAREELPDLKDSHHALERLGYTDRTMLVDPAERYCRLSLRDSGEECS